jgi:hypothetical protein
MTPHGTSIFCDDIRFEQQSKFSLIGCYGPELIVYQAPPVALPKFGILVYARFPVERLPVKKLMVFLPKTDEPWFTQEIPADPEDFDLASLSKPVEGEKDLEKGRGMLCPLLFSPFPIPSEGYVRVRIACGEKTVRAGALKVVFQPPPSSDTAPPVAP